MLLLEGDVKEVGKVDNLILELEEHIGDFKSKSAIPLSNSEVERLITEFQEKFPKEKLAEFTFEEYALGTDQKDESYSYWLEYRTKDLASIKGGPVKKHGIWFSKEEGIFKAADKFQAGSEEASMDILRRALLDLLENGELQDFRAIEDNILANGIKYKTLYMYYPNLYLPMSADDHYSYLLKELGYIPDQYQGVGAKQRILLEIKRIGEGLSELTNYEYVHFLYYLFGVPRRKKPRSPEIWIDGGVLKSKIVEEGDVEATLKMNYQVLEVKMSPLKKRQQEVSGIERKAFKPDYEERQRTRAIIGAKGETLVMKYEQDRLKKFPKLCDQIEQKSGTDDGLGYDILSFETDGQERFIEVKTTKGKVTSKLNFYLTDNELQKAKDMENYWIYVVSEIDSVMPKIIPIARPFADENQGCLEMKPTQYLVSIGVSEKEEMKKLTTTKAPFIKMKTLALACHLDW